ncbi:MAG TPA: hypothetical protein VIY28_05765 [Pseudonocardiaceae bacterium]
MAAGLYVRLKIEETPIFRQAQQQPTTYTPLREAFTQAPREILLAAGTVTMASPCSTPARPTSPATAPAPPAQR